MKWCSLLVLLLFAFGPIVIAQETETQASGDVLTLQEAVDLALKNNLDIKTEEYNPEISDTFVANEASRFEPLFSGNLSNENADIPTGSRLAGEGTLQNENLAYDLRWDHLLTWGTSYNVVFNNSRQKTNQLFTSFNPRFDSSLFANVRQPLMRNFGRDITLTPINIAKTDRLASDARLNQRILDVELQVTQAYLDYAFAQAELEVFKQSLVFAQDLYENNKKQVEVGTMAPLEVVVAQAEVATKEQAIIAGEVAIKNREDILRTLIYGDKVQDWNQTISIPLERPTFTDISITEEQAINIALKDNPDIKALEMDLKSNNLTTKLARNRMKPLMDLSGSVGYTGLGGDQLVFGGDIFNPVPIGTVPGNYGDALGNLWENPTWNVGLIIELPIGNKNAEADYVRADLTEKQTNTILENTRQQLIMNVRTALRNIRASLKLIESSRVTVVLQEKKLDAERKKLNVGLSTNNIVLDFQDDLSQARSVELASIIAYLKNVAQLERFMGGAKIFARRQG
ncbi:TolC family protein [bacterium]|nr:TolC family protein [bacterium]